MIDIKRFDNFILESVYTHVGTITEISDLDYYDIPDEIINLMSKWDVIFKSPYSDSFYNSTDIGWGSKPDGSYRVSDHWNFIAHDKLHCPTNIKVTNNTHVSIGKWDAKSKIYNILLSLPTREYLQGLEFKSKKDKFLKNPDLIEKKKELKEKIKNGEIFATIKNKYDKTYHGKVVKYTGSSLKIVDNKTDELIYNNNYLDIKEDTVTLYDINGNTIENILIYRK